ncbi:TrkH family potassium uptake protein [Streptomyces sp. NP160]|uniref:TrkH family potassium uptake protein n=1 Tax=Streptomyces sp. NP160 TaxID=2586637 RepID=UPI00214B49EF|nr:potassium transporter TrkG [Streptomyces sp. NP160]
MPDSTASSPTIPARRTPRARAPHPGRVIAGGFAAAIAVGTVLLALPIAHTDGSVDLIAALFTATSAVSVTGLAIVDTGTAWTVYGHVVIMLLVQLGGLGITTAATLVALLLSRRLGLRARLVAQTESRSLSAGDVRTVIRTVFLFSIASEAVFAVLLFAKWALLDGEPVLRTAWRSVFYAVMSFNNAGFSLASDSLVRYADDPATLLIICAATLLGGLGFPVVFELARGGLRGGGWRHPRSWSVLTRVTVTVTVWLLAVGTALLAVFEVPNPATLGALDPVDAAVGAFTLAVMAGSAGFNAIDIGAMTPEGLLVTDVLMFIGGGSASTAGGIKVTTFGLLAAVLWAELRGDVDVEVGRRRVPAATQRQALAVALLGIGIVAVGTLALHATTDQPTDIVLFEAVSAFGTVGLSTGVTADLPTAAQVVIVVLMYIGRIGPVTLASALALRERAKLHHLPEERMIVG